jgi:GMP synthase (glutamine-hydrolysing)
MVEALGGDVRHDEAATEVGTFEITLTRAAANDDLFRGLPPNFRVQLGHKDRAITMPDNVTLLARSERCPYQAFKVNNALIYATQFHPELTKHNNRGRFLRYRDIYMDALGAAGFEEVLQGFGPSPECSTLLRRFRDLVEG